MQFYIIIITVYIVFYLSLALYIIVKYSICLHCIIKLFIKDFTNLSLYYYFELIFVFIFMKQLFYKSHYYILVKLKIHLFATSIYNPNLLYIIKYNYILILIEIIMFFLCLLLFTVIYLSRSGLWMNGYTSIKKYE